MRRLRYWLIGLVGVAALVGGSVAFYYKFVDTEYVRAEFYADTGVDPQPMDPPGGIAWIVFIERPGRITLALVRGEPHGIVTTSHGWQERLQVEFPRPTTPGPIKLDHPDVVSAFGAFDGRKHAEIGDGGIRGELRLESVGDDRIVAEYDVTVEACFRSPYPYDTRRSCTTVVFRGRSTFRLRQRPDGVFGCDLWPRPSATKK